MILPKLLFFNKENKFYIEKKHTYDAGYDLITNEDIIIKPGLQIVKTGIYFAGFDPSIVFIEGYSYVMELQVRPRSGLATKGITVHNSPGTIDAGYRGEIGVIIYNFTEEEILLKAGKGLAQLVPNLIPLMEVKYVSEEEWQSSSIDNRGMGGFGHTDKTGDF